MFYFNTDGLVIKVNYTDEADRILAILSRDRGVIRAFAKGARRPKSKLHAGTGFLCYSNLQVCDSKETLKITEASIIELFYEARCEIDKLALSEHFCELALELCPEGEPAAEYLRLVLNALHFLASGQKAQLLLKSIVQLRMLSLAGYMPGLIACDECGEYETDHMYFDCLSGLLYCDKCHKAGQRLPLSVISAMRHIVFSDFAKCFSFSLAEPALSELSEVCSMYLKNKTQRDYPALDFYMSLL